MTGFSDAETRIKQNYERKLESQRLRAIAKAERQVSTLRFYMHGGGYCKEYSTQK